MATSNFLRRQRKLQAANASREQIQAEKKANQKPLTFAEKSKLAWKLIKSGKASNQKEAWAIIKEKY